MLRTNPCSRVCTSRSHYASTCRCIISTSSASLWLCTSSCLAVLLKCVKLESAHASSQPNDRFVAVSPHRCFQRTWHQLSNDMKEARRWMESTVCGMANDCSSPATRCVVNTDQTGEITQRLRIQTPSRILHELPLSCKEPSRRRQTAALTADATPSVFFVYFPSLTVARARGSRSSLLVVTLQLVSPLCS